MNTANKQKVIDFLHGQNMDIDFQYHLNGADFETADDIREILDEAGAFNIEIIYYSRAMEYLSKYDRSLKRSLEIAHNLGYKCNGLNSEILASMLASEDTRQEFEDIYNELKEFIEDLDEDEDDAIL